VLSESNPEQRRHSHAFLCDHNDVRDAHGKGKHAIPETRGTEEGSAKRNITRKHNHDKKEKKQRGGAGGKGKWNVLDDGSMDY